MKTLLLIIFMAGIGFNCIMATPLGALWTAKNLDEGKPCYGIIIIFLTIIPLMIIGTILGIIK